MRRLVSMLFFTVLAVMSGAFPALSADFRFETYFAGRTVAEGEFSAINGVHRTFKVVLTGTWNGKRLKLIEDFTYSDGERDRKTWRFVKTGANTYTGTREDVADVARVTINGKVATYAYNVYLDGKARKNLVRFHDRMVLNDDGTVLNTALVTKFGFPVAKTRVTFRRR